MTVYTSPTCAPCKTLKYLLTKKGIKFEEKGTDDPTYEELANAYGLIVPLTVMDNGMVYTGLNTGIFA